MRMRNMLLALTAASAAVTGVLIAQAPQAPPPPQPASDVEAPIFTQDVVNVQVPVTVRDQKGNFVSGLVPVDFQLFDDGVPQAIVQDVASHPMSLVIVVQSDSTAR